MRSEKKMKNDLSEKFKNKINKKSTKSIFLFYSTLKIFSDFIQ